MKTRLAIAIPVYAVSIFYAHAQTVTGTNFVLADPQGNTTAQLTTSSEGTPALFFFDQNHVARISIGLYPDGAPGVVLNDNQGRASAIVRLVQTTGNPVVVLKENGTDRVIMDENWVQPKQEASSNNLPPSLIGFLSGLAGGLLAIFIARKKEVLLP